VAKIPVVLSQHKYNVRRSVAVDDKRPPTNGNENGMNAAGSVMKAAGEWTKVGSRGHIPENHRASD
jgi:hypothetical protein